MEEHVTHGEDCSLLRTFHKNKEKVNHQIDIHSTKQCTVICLENYLLRITFIRCRFGFVIS